MEKVKTSNPKLENVLQEGNSEITIEKKPPKTAPPTAKSTKTKIGFLKRIDWGMTLMLRSLCAGIPAMILTGILAGIFEEATGLDVDFFSTMFFFVSVPQFLVFFYAFMKTYIHFGTFEKTEQRR